MCWAIHLGGYRYSLIWFFQYSLKRDVIVTIYKWEHLALPKIKKGAQHKLVKWRRFKPWAIFWPQCFTASLWNRYYISSLVLDFLFCKPGEDLPWGFEMTCVRVFIMYQWWVKVELHHHQHHYQDLTFHTLKGVYRIVHNQTIKEVNCVCVWCVTSSLFPVALCTNYSGWNLTLAHAFCPLFRIKKKLHWNYPMENRGVCDKLV